MGADKAGLRASLLAARRGTPAEQRSAAGAEIAAHLLATPEIAAAGIVAGYVGTGTEPPTQPLLEELHRRGVRVLLPVLRADDDLDWAEFTGERALVRARRGLLEPAGPRLGVESVGGVDVVVCPGLAVGPGGVRLGRGGGSYDRVLSRVATAGAGGGRPWPWTCVLLFDDEVLDAVPAASHDRAVDAAVTPSGVTRFG